MKATVLFVITAVLLAGCMSSPKAMKTDRKYFKPIAAHTQLNKTTAKQAKLTPAMVQRELDEKTTMIELLKKENQQLRERVAKLEKRLSIIQS